MTVAELRAALDSLPPEADGWTVVLSQDAEGNAFSPLRDRGQGHYESFAPWSGDYFDALLPLNASGLWPVRQR